MRLPPSRQAASLTSSARLTPASPDIEVDTGLMSLSIPAIVEGLPSQLLSRRPDVAAAEQQLIAANADITVARAALFPSIQLTASGGYESSALTSLVSPPHRVYALTAGLTQPIFHGGALRGHRPPEPSATTTPRIARL